MKTRIEYLESLLPKNVVLQNGDVVTVDEKYRDNFNKYARYEGNGVYQWRGIRSNDTAELFLLGVLNSEKIKFKQI